MASFRKRESGLWQATVRMTGYPSQSKTFERKIDAEIWARKIETDIDKGIFQNSSDAEKTTLTDLIDRLLTPAPARPHESLNIHVVLERVLRLAENDAGWAVKLVRDYDPSLPELPGDADRLTQAVWNLVRNALQAGASEVINMDMASSTLALGRENHQLNQLTGAKFFAHDIFSSWGKLKRLGPYDLVIADPPSYQKGSFVATKDYARLVRRLPDLLTAQGHALLCLNAPELSSQFLRDTVEAEAPALQFIQRLANPPAFADVDEERSLKVLVYQQGPATF